MKNLIKEAPNVANAFFSLTTAIRETSTLSIKQNELVLIGIFTANRGLKGLVTHVIKALEVGASKGEIVSAVVLALPITGIISVNIALEVVLDTIEKYNQKN